MKGNHILLLGILSGMGLSISTSLLASEFGTSENLVSKDNFAIIGTEYYQRSQFVTGEVRIFLKNTSKEPRSVSQCKLRESIVSNSEKLNKGGAEVNHFCSKLSPPILMPERNGELLVKLLKTPPTNSELRCTIYDDTGKISHSSILIKQAPLWIPYVGFSDDLSEIYVYAQNKTQKPLKLQLLKVAGIDVNDKCRSINNSLPPDDKGCLAFKMPTPLTFGEYVDVAVSAESSDQKWQTHRIVRAVNNFPLLFEGGLGDPKLGLDSERFYIDFTSPSTAVPCIQTMICPAHYHGAHANAAKKFLESRNSIFSQDQYLLTQMWICRFDIPQSWYKFGPLPDVAGMNPILLALSAYKSDAKASGQFSPFFWLATVAKKATAPNRYLACIPLNPDDAFFWQTSHTPDEIKFLIYCAVASGSKGIVYRGNPPSDRLSRDGFTKLNNELQQLEPLLITAEPVNWASTANKNYIAKALLCGDKAILVVVFDRRYFSEQKGNKLRTPAFGKSLNPIKIKVKVPEEFLVSRVESMYNILSKKLWNWYANNLCFTANMIDSVEVYKIIIQQNTR